MKTITVDKTDSKLSFLLREELKSRKLAKILSELGVEEQCPWLPSFNEEITKHLGLETDEIFREYDTLIHKCIDRIRHPNHLGPLVNALELAVRPLVVLRTEMRFLTKLARDL